MFTINYALVFWSEQYISSGLAAVLQATIPSFGLVFAHFYLPEERLKWERVLGALLALGGVTIICAKLLDFQGIMAFWGGVGIVVGAAAASYSNVLIKARRKKFAPSMISAWQMLFSRFRRCCSSDSCMKGTRRIFIGVKPPSPACFISH